MVRNLNSSKHRILSRRLLLLITKILDVIHCPVTVENKRSNYFCTDLHATCFTYPINDLGTTQRFADFTLKDIDVQSRGQFHISPQNSLILCSTPSVIEMYEKLGYKILPAELVNRDTSEYSHNRPWDLINTIVQAGSGWLDDPIYLN
jgi:hypothetical protein